MEKWEQPPPPKTQAPPRRNGNNPSFSSSLLDAICRSLDDSDTATNNNHSLPPPPQPNLRRYLDPSDDPRHRRFSSEPKFSSSDFDTTARPRPILTRSNLIRIIEPPPLSQKKRSGRSPGARLAAFMNTIFAGGKVKFDTKTSVSCKVKQELGRISPVSVDVAEEKCVRDGDRAARKSSQKSAELLQGLGKIEEEDWELFELDSVSVVGRCKHELPVYETTMNHAKSRAFM